MDASAAVALSDTGDRWSAPDRPRAEFRLLGYFEVGDGDGTQAFGGPKQRALLAYLLLHAGEVVTTERLVDAIWGDDPPPTATAIVYGYVRKLRSALEATSATLTTRSSGYVLDIPGGSLDVAQFERLAGLGRQALRAGDVADARRLLGSALALWRGLALDGLDGEGFIRAEQLRLESLRLTTILGRIDSDLRLGGAVDVVEDLEALAREHPLDEGIRGQLMVALYRTGNQAEALAAYQDIRRALAEELGLDPSRSLQELEGAILRQDPSLDLPGPQTGQASVPVALRTAATALRLVESGDACPFVGLATFGVTDADVFFGRERLVSEMVARLAEHGFLGVIGPSGSGKSSAVRAGLVPAIETGALGETGWVRAILRPGAEPMRELDRVVFAALDESQRSRLPAGQDPLLAAVSVLPEGTRLLVIVDQFEEVFTSVDDAALRSAFIESLVRAARGGTAAVVLALRADFYGRCAEEPALAEQLSASQVLVGPMGRAEYGSVIEGPAARAGLNVEPALVERLIDEVEGRPGGLPLLSTALVELWERRDGRTIPLSALAATGGISGAVGRLAENAYGQLTDAEQATARIVFLRLAGWRGGGDGSTAGPVGRVRHRGQPGRAANPHRADGRPAAHGRPRHGRGRPRGAVPRVATARGLARRGPAEPAGASAPHGRRPRVGRERPLARRALSRCPPGGRARLVGRARRRGQRPRAPVRRGEPGCRAGGGASSATGELPAPAAACRGIGGPGAGHRGERRGARPAGGGRGVERHRGPAAGRRRPGTGGGRRPDRDRRARR